MITVVVGKEIEKIKGDFESYLNGLNMVGEISYSQYSELYDEGTKQIQRAYELGKAELEKENAELEKDKDYFSDALDKQIEATLKLQKKNAELKETLKTYNGCGDWDNDFHTCRVYLQHEELQDYIEQLTKAKEIIKYLLSFIQKENYRTRWDINIAEAEQFLKE